MPQSSINRVYLYLYHVEQGTGQGRRAPGAGAKCVGWGPVPPRLTATLGAPTGVGAGPQEAQHLLHKPKKAELAFPSSTKEVPLASPVFPAI